MLVTTVHLRIYSPSKTKEQIVFKSRIRHVLPPASPIISGAERVSSLRVLGVVISSDLGISAHLDQVLSSCASSTCMYALRVLRSHGLQPQNASRSNKNDHHCFFDVCLTCLVGLLFRQAGSRSWIDDRILAQVEVHHHKPWAQCP